VRFAAIFFMMTAQEASALKSKAQAIDFFADVFFVDEPHHFVRRLREEPVKQPQRIVVVTTSSSFD